ncbi:MAG: zinc-ribbon domain-containing protein [Lachnospiraceae bacterium]|nr:zinc-ribbon domain-containing protein [Ruminococcus sp.]MCM1276004.1 zinc-ribbon domain-containing protein [Lachnospiraceae bacterium]
MFCTNCGKEIIDTARFCNFCGAAVSNAAESVPVSESVSEMPEAPESAEMPSVDGAYEYAAESAEEAAEPFAETVENAVPTPNDIPSYGGSAPVYSAPPVYPEAPVSAVPAVSEIPVQSAPESKPERRYTLGHIMMCLAAVAVMAIVAGVFAGLYFSVV